VLFCYYGVVLCIDLCTVTLPPGVNPIAVDKYIYLSIYYFHIKALAGGFSQLQAR